MKTNVHFWSYPFQNDKYFRQKLSRKENQNMFIFSIFFFNCAVYEIVWQNTVELDGPQTAIWRVRIACWTPKTLM